LQNSGDEKHNNTMDETTLNNLILKLAQWKKSGESHIIWHGGEPLLAGIDFFKKIVELQALIKNHIFENSIQTNGTLLNYEYLDFFERHNFKLGFSLDGCKTSHDLNRPYKDGLSSFEDTLKWMQEARARKIGGKGAICVLNN